jgi:hypothetical protein
LYEDITMLIANSPTYAILTKSVRKFLDILHLQASVEIQYGIEWGAAVRILIK